MYLSASSQVSKCHKHTEVVQFFFKKKKTLQLTRPLTCLVVIVVISRALSTNTSDPMWRYAASMFDVSRIELQNLRCIGMGVMTEYLWEYMA